MLFHGSPCFSYAFAPALESTQVTDLKALARRPPTTLSPRTAGSLPGTSFRLKSHHGFCPLAPARSANCGTIAARCCARIAGACAFRVVAAVAPCTTRMKPKNINQFITPSTIRNTRFDNPRPLTIRRSSVPRHAIHQSASICYWSPNLPSLPPPRRSNSWPRSTQYRSQAPSLVVLRRERRATPRKQR